MEYTIENHEIIAAKFLAEWTRRSEKLFPVHGEGCFVWDSSDRDNNTGKFYKKDMVPNYFGEPWVSELLGLIDEADHKAQLVVAMVFDTKVIAMRVGKDPISVFSEILSDKLHEVAL